METAMIKENPTTTTTTKIKNKQQELMTQNLSDIDTLTMSSRQVISRQATLNIGLVGHVSHGKSTIVKAITGVRTAKRSDEIRDNHTKILGFANAKIYKCPKCEPPTCYKSYPSDYDDSPPCPNPRCSETLALVRHVSFCDCPGHEKFMSTMLSGASIFDSAILALAANVECPQPQTIQHVNALQILGIRSSIIAQNKIDLIFHNRDLVKQNYKQIRSFCSSNICRNSPIVPVAAELQYNIDAILESIYQLPEPERLLNVPPIMNIIRSFDVNKPGTPFHLIQGGVVGGTIIAGILAVGMEVELKPGLLTRNKDGETVCTTVRTIVVSLSAEKNSLEYAVPGGLIGVGLQVDPSLTRGNKMVGNILGKAGTLPELVNELTLKFYMIKRIMGCSGAEIKISKIKEGDSLRMNVRSCECEAKVLRIFDDIVVVFMSRPIYVEIEDKIAFSRRVDSKYRLIGYGQVKNSKPSELLL